jgi:hypothetical protein
MVAMAVFSSRYTGLLVVKRIFFKIHNVSKVLPNPLVPWMIGFSWVDVHVVD